MFPSLSFALAPVNKCTDLNDILLLQGVRAISDRSWEYFLPVYISAAAYDEGGAPAAVSTTALLFAARALAGLVLSPLFAAAWRPSRLPFYIAIENISLVCSALALAL